MARCQEQIIWIIGMELWWWVSLAKFAKPLFFGLEVPGNYHSNLDPDLVDQVDLGEDGLAGALVHDVLLNHDFPPLRVEGPTVPYTKPVEPGGGFLAYL